MSRNLLVIISVLAISACTDGRHHDRTADRADSQPGDSHSSSGGAANVPGDAQPRSAPSHDSGMNDTGANSMRSSEPTASSSVASDHTDQRGSSLTAGDQSEHDADRRITQQVRQAVVADQEMSIKAKNCTIICIDGVVTLRGSVDTAAERQSIGMKADGVPGVRRVDNNLEISR